METDLKTKHHEEVLEQVLEILEREEDEIEALIEEKVAQRMKLKEERLKY